MAFRLASDLPPRDAPYTREELEAAAGTLHPAIEIINPIWVDFLNIGVAHVIADNSANGGLVLGDAIEDWRELDLAGAGVKLSIGGAEVAAGAGADVLGHPLEALAWQANALSAQGLTLAAGQLVSTGTMTMLNIAEPDAPVVADFGALGRVTLLFRS